jgi:hypothetical protein
MYSECAQESKKQVVQGSKLESNSAFSKMLQEQVKCTCSVHKWIL